MLKLLNKINTKFKILNIIFIILYNNTSKLQRVKLYLVLQTDVISL